MTKKIDARAITSVFTFEQEQAIWSVIQYIAKMQSKNPKAAYHKDDVFYLIEEELK